MLKNICYKRHIVIIAVIALMGFLFTQCTNNRDKIKATAKNQTDYKSYAGTLSCAKCHQKIYDAHLLTAHNLTSQISTEKNIKGSFEKDKNRFYYFQNMYVAVEKRGEKFFQVEYIDETERNARPFDITVGSGKRGQSFLHWNQQKLFQLPLTYFTSEDQWTNSPGYSNRIVYNRPITSRCLECHSTYVQKLPDDPSPVENFSNTNIIYGVNCEKCHGAGAKHVAFHTEHPKETKAQFIINPKNFTRLQSLDMCRLCHGGRLSKTQASFSFQPGDKLSDFFLIDTVSKNISEIDVHGNQYGMLAASKCFKSSEMTCSTCHSSHENETGKTVTFSQRCVSCHTPDKNSVCTKIKATDKLMQTNCIQCHMPEQRSRAIMVLLQGQNIPTPAFMRSHFISIYKEETEKVLAKKTVSK